MINSFLSLSSTELSLTDDNIAEVFSTATVLGMADILQQCQDLLYTNITPDNVITVWKTALRQQLTDVAENALKVSLFLVFYTMI